MKSLFTLIFSISSLHICYAQATVTYAQTVQSMTNKHLIVYLDTTHLIDVVVTFTEASNLEIHTNIYCPHGKKAVLEYLKRDGRYDLKVYEHSKFYATVLSMDKEFHYVFINDTEYQENIIYHLSIPKGTTYDIRVPQTDKPKQMPIAIR